MLITWIYLVLGTQLAFANQLPSDIEKCSFGDAKCIAKSMNYVIREYGKKGLPAINVPPLSDYKVNPINLIQDDLSKPIWYKGKIQNILIKGLENVTVTKVVGFGRDPKDMDSEIHAIVPSLVATTKFDFKYRLLALALNFSGNSVADLQNFQFKTKMSFIMDERGYVKIYKFSIKTKSDRWITDLRNVNSDNTDLTLLVTQWLNDNWLDLWNDAEPTVSTISRDIFVTVLNSIFSTIRYEDMFLKPF